MLLVTVGTEQYPFNALMNWVDLLIREGLIDRDEEVIVQYGSSSKLPDKVRIFKRLPESEFKALLEQARVVISHCGEGSAMLLESLGKPYVLVPRTRRFGEHVDDHQLEMADAMEKQGISVARSPGDLVRFLAEPKVLGLIPKDEEKLCEFLSNSYDYNKYKKIMLICSSGGHFKYAQSLNPFLEQFQDVCWVTFQTSTTESVLKTEKSVYWAHSPTNRNLPNLLRNLILAFKVLRHEQPDLVLSTGAGIAVPFLFIGQDVVLYF
jgi:UDP-N-acetylglucosamine transferase subunit ALG13